MSGTSVTSSRIDQRFTELRRRRRAGLVTFLTAGDPDHVTSLALLQALPEAGADIIEHSISSISR
jgi:tryptophan synthase alpha chain